MPDSMVVVPASDHWRLPRNKRSDVDRQLDRAIPSVKPLPIRIMGTGVYLPPKVLQSEEIDSRLGKPRGSIERDFGIRERHVVAAETVVEMAAAAARDALHSAYLAPTDIDCIIAASSVPHQAIPTTAVLVQRSLGLHSQFTPAFDINATCLSFLVALDSAAALVAAGRYKNVLIVSAEVPSRAISWDEPEAAAIFGDGAAAVIVSGTTFDGAMVLASRLETYSTGADFCELRAGGSGIDPRQDMAEYLKNIYFRMNGPLAYRLAARHMPAFLERLMADGDTQFNDIDMIVPHQASAKALEHIRRRLLVDPSRVVDLFSSHGNQVAASLPTALHAGITRGQIRRGDLILLVGTAAGISLGGTLLRY